MRQGDSFTIDIVATDVDGEYINHNVTWDTDLIDFRFYLNESCVDEEVYFSIRCSYISSIIPPEAELYVKYELVFNTWDRNGDITT